MGKTTLIVSGEAVEFENIMTLEDAARAMQPRLPYLAAICENTVVDLHTPAREGMRVSFVDYSHEEGKRVYVRSLSFIFTAAMKRLYPDSDVLIDHSLGDALYCQLVGTPFLERRDYGEIERCMREMIEIKQPFLPVVMQKEAAAEYFLGHNRALAADNMRSSMEESVTLYECSGIMDCYYGPLLPHAGYLQHFALQHFFPGIVLQYPTFVDGEMRMLFNPHPLRAAAFFEAEMQSDFLGISYLPMLNKKVRSGSIREVIRICEITHEQKLTVLAKEIVAHEKQLILIAGPSSSGKTTFANRLYSHLMALGKRPVTLSMDNFFKERPEIELDDFGKRDIENVTALDKELFAESLNRLLYNEEVEIPQFNFISGQKEWKGNYLTVGKGQPIIVEGIHALNPMLTDTISDQFKYRMFANPLIPLNLDCHNRFPTADLRLLRRMVRDYKFRGHKAEGTLDMWYGVLRGERKYIFPFQETADTVFNTSLIYEPALLKIYAYPLLQEIADGEYGYEARRLLRLLDCVQEADASLERDVPPTSLLREFIGGNTFYM